MDFKCGVIESICAELIGTFLISSILLSGSTFNVKINRNETKYLQSEHHLNKLSIEDIKGTENVIAFGLLFTSAVTYTIHISGGHLNPAVTLGALVCGYIRIIPGICYILAQIIGALLGEVSAKLIEKKYDELKFERSEFSIELLASFLLVSVYLSVVDYRAFGNDIGSASLAVGLTAAITMLLPNCRFSYNLAISLATSVHFEHFVFDWVNWMAPLLGGLMAGIVYRILTQYRDGSLVHVDYSKSLVTIKVRSP